MSRGPLLLALLMLGMPVQAIEPGPDPVPSVMWEFYRKQWIKDDPYLFDARVRVIAPPFAEDARQVPLQIDARDVPGKVTRIIAWAELNPLPTIVDFQPGPHVLPWLAIRIRIEQANGLARSRADRRRRLACRLDPDRCGGWRLYGAQRGAQPT